MAGRRSSCALFPFFPAEYAIEIRFGPVRGELSAIGGSGAASPAGSLLARRCIAFAFVGSAAIGVRVFVMSPRQPRQEVSMVPLTVHALAYGASDFPESLLFADGAPGVRVPFGWLCYAIQLGRDGGWVLVDTGFRDAGFASEYVLTEYVDPLALLAQLGGRAEDVRAIVLTHHHFDHAGNLHRFPHAHVYMHEEVAETPRSHVTDGRGLASALCHRGG